jgi:hypothetical protein
MPALVDYGVGNTHTWGGGGESRLTRCSGVGRQGRGALGGRGGKGAGGGTGRGGGWMEVGEGQARGRTTTPTHHPSIPPFHTATHHRTTTTARCRCFLHFPLPHPPPPPTPRPPHPPARRRTTTTRCRCWRAALRDRPARAPSRAARSRAPRWGAPGLLPRLLNFYKGFYGASRTHSMPKQELSASCSAVFSSPRPVCGVEWTAAQRTAHGRLMPYNPKTLKCPSLLNAIKCHKTCVQVSWLVPYNPLMPSNPKMP